MSIIRCRQSEQLVTLRSSPAPTVTIYCITSPTVRSIEVKKIAGSNWEAAVAESGIQGLSKPRQQAAGSGGGGG